MKNISFAIGIVVGAVVTKLFSEKEKQWRVWFQTQDGRTGTQIVTAKNTLIACDLVAEKEKLDQKTTLFSPALIEESHVKKATDSTDIKKN